MSCVNNMWNRLFSNGCIFLLVISTTLYIVYMFTVFGIKRKILSIKKHTQNCVFGRFFKYMVSVKEVSLMLVPIVTCEERIQLIW